MRSEVFKAIKKSKLDPQLKDKALKEITHLEGRVEFEMDTTSLEDAFEWSESLLGQDFWAEISHELSYAGLELQNYETEDYDHMTY